MKKFALILVVVFGGIVGSHAVSFESLTGLSNKMIEEQRLAEEATEMAYDFNFELRAPQAFVVAGYEDAFEQSGFKAGRF